MNTNQLRQAFLDFFISQQHQLVPSSSLIPANDPTLLFTNAGMVQFKEVFLGQEQRDYTRAASSQRCVRAGGKHNDLENVGYTARHHTFFEMLGNFSFGDYFKQQAIEWSWQFLTQVLKLPTEKLWVTVYQDDDQAADIWLKQIKVDANRFSRCGEADNFWSMGDTGPCGPCTEIFYDHGPDIPGGPPGSDEAEGDRYVEIWNLVFMEFNRQSDGTLTPLPKPSVDTGMGLERIAAVVQGVHSNYDIDIFQQLIKAIRKIINCNETKHVSLNVIADHIRSCAFLICDGVVPSNEGRGYVLRRIIRRAVRHGHKLGATQTFFHQLVAPLVKEMGEAYPDLAQAQSRIEQVLLKEEQQFARTLDQGLKILEQDIANLSSDMISGETIFKLYDTYGFPADLTGDIARERGLQLDMQGFEQAMQQQRSQSQAASSFAHDYNQQIKLDVASTFSGYESLTQDSEVLLLLSDGQHVKQLTQGQTGVVVLAETPFYAESGGQVGDQGQLLADNTVFTVEDTQKIGQAIAHVGTLKKGSISTGQTLQAQVDATKRRATMLNHTATHLLHAALRQVLGEHVLQKGSLVAPDRLRFDFAHFNPVTEQQLQAIESLVNQHIQLNAVVNTEQMTPEQAKQAGAMALFGEKYGDTVRVLSINDFSKELCGGTHVKHTGDIGLFKITLETGIAAGIRRIEAVTGTVAINTIQQQQQQLQQIAQLTKCHSDDVVEKVEQLLTKLRQLQKQIEQLQSRIASNVGGDLAQQAKQIGSVQLLATQMPGADMKALRQTLDQLKSKMSPAVIVLVGINQGKMQVVAGISKSLIGEVPSPKLLVETIGASGGGRDDMAQGGGDVPADLEQRIASIANMIAEKV